MSATVRVILWQQTSGYTTLVWGGGLLALGGDIGGIGAVPPAGPGTEAESFLFHY